MEPVEELRRIALALPDASEGVACEGTKLERRTMKVRSKAFVFLGAGDVMVKLTASLAEASRLAEKFPEVYRVGANGWVKATFTAEAPPPMKVFERWIAESHRSVAGGAAPKPKSTSKAAPKARTKTK